MTATPSPAIAAMTEAEKLELAKKYRDAYWGGSWLKQPEDIRIEALNHACVVICCGDTAAGLRLAREAIYG